jgi:hypothetical protein
MSARRRLLHPEQATNEKVCGMSVPARYTFCLLPCFADREGRLADDPFRLRLSILPVDAVDMNALLAELAQQGLVRRYVADGRRCIQIVNFARYQKPHPNEQKSILPAEPQTPTCNHGEPLVNHGEPKVNLGAPKAEGGGAMSSGSLDPVTLDPVTLDPENTDTWSAGGPAGPCDVGDEPVLKLVEAPEATKAKTRKPTKPDSSYSESFVRFWAMWPKKVKKEDSWLVWRTKRCEQHLDAILLALAWQVKSAKWTEAGGKYITYPDKYLRGKLWQDDPSGYTSATTRRADGKPGPQPYEHPCGLCGGQHPISAPCSPARVESGSQ